MTTPSSPRSDADSAHPPVSAWRADPSPSETASPDYHRAYVNANHGIGRGIGALVTLLTGFIVLSVIVYGVGSLTEVAMYGQNVALAGGAKYTPVTFITMFSGSAFLIPWSILVQKWFYGLPGNSLASVRSVFRPSIVGRTVIYVLPVWAVYIASLTVTAPPLSAEPLSALELGVIFGAALILTPLQAAGEEFAFRGVTFRIFGCWTRSPRTGLVLGVLASSVGFGLFHAATDPWLIFYYTATGVGMAIITWLTGGLECSIAIHTINNTLSTLLMLVLFQSMVIPDRTNGAGSPVLLIPIALLGAIIAVIGLRKKRGIHRASAGAPSGDIVSDRKEGGQ